MKEDFIAYLWKNKLLEPGIMFGVDGQKIEVLDPGQQNRDSGPDFFAARLRLDDTLWVGNVEIHVRTSDWQRHGHQNDPAYDSIILHVVYEHDTQVHTSKGKTIPVLEVKEMIREKLLENYQQLLSNVSWIPCQENLLNIDPFFINNWLNRLLVERLERKAAEVLHYLHFFSGDWDQTFFFLLARNFGFKTNASPFGLLAQRTPFSILAKNSNNYFIIEAILFGQAGLLHAGLTDEYPGMLFKEYNHQCSKYNLKAIDRKLWKFARLRPVNFPTLRISQFAALLQRLERPFRKAMLSSSLDDLQELLQVKASPYWDRHYTFDKPSAKKEKNLGADAIRNLIINTIAPVKFVYGQESLNMALKENAIALMQSCPAENNAIVSAWQSIGVQPQNAADSQALLELKKYYCTPGKCLRCPIGHLILRRS